MTGWVCMLAWWCSPVLAMTGGLATQVCRTYGNELNQRSWTRRPHLGEAENHGPSAGFDNEGSDAWSESSCLGGEAPENPGGWVSPPPAEEAERVGGDLGQTMVKAER